MGHRAIIFDLFGTLVNGFMSVTGQTQEQFAAILGVPCEPFTKLWREITGRRTVGEFQTVEASIEHVCGALGISVNAEQMAKAVEFRLEYTKRALTPKADAVKTLENLKQSGFKIGLLSNCSIEIPVLWSETEFADLIERPVFSSRERLKKPDPRIYHLACERLGVSPKDCVYVADGENYELTAAGEVGMHSVLIRNSSLDDGKEILREAREWRGATIQTLTEVPILLNTCT